MRRLGLVWAAILVVAFPSPAHAQLTLPADFEQVTLASGFTAPTAVAWTPDGRMLVAEKAGRVHVVLPDGTRLTDPLLDISGHVNSFSDRGLLGLAVDSDFANNGYVYLLYVWDRDPLAADDSQAKASRLTRITLRPDNTLENAESPETVILGSADVGVCPAPSNAVDCIPADAETHAIGTVRSDADGTLWIGSGDATPNGTFQQAFRAWDERSYAGKILHVDRAGRGLPGHPFCPSDTDLTHVCTKIHAEGFRNPFRFHLRPGKQLIVGDVGSREREEVDLPTGGRNYGWPCYQGSIRTPGYEDTPECLDLYSKEGTAEAAMGAVYEYPTGGTGAVVAGPVYTGDDYPQEYRGDIFVGDYAQGWIKRLRLDASDNLMSVADFATGWQGGVDLEPAPNGELAYVKLGDGTAGTGSVGRISYAPRNRVPIAEAAATPTSGPVPLDVSFSAAGSVDPDGDPLSYTWDFGDGRTSTGPETSHVYDQVGAYTATLTVDDGRGKRATDSVAISVGIPPVPRIDSPADGSLFKAGEPVTLKGSATDVENGELGGSSLSWHVTLHHGGHIHDFATLSGSPAQFQTAKDHDADSYYEISLTATDADGLSAATDVRINPQTITLRLASEPPGAPVTYADTTGTAPFEITAAVGFLASVSAAEQFQSGGVTWIFDGWSDGGERLHYLEVPETDTTLVARYRAPPERGSTPTNDPGEPAPLALLAVPVVPDVGDSTGPVIRLGRLGRRALRGRVSDPSGVAWLRVALRAANRRGGCRWWSPRLGRLRPRGRRCDRPLWMRLRPAGLAAGGPWRLALGGSLRPGRYTVRVRAADRLANLSMRTKTMRSGSVRRAR